MRRKLIALWVAMLVMSTSFPTAQAAPAPQVKKEVREAPITVPAPPPAEETVTYQTPLPEPTPTPVATPTSVAPGSCGDNEYAAFIYGNESGGKVPGHCNPKTQNAEGCIGIGQACPASKLIAVCPNLDYACENVFFTKYAIDRYGSWLGAYQFWVAHNYW